jgi:hypothetical protein
VDSLAHLAVTDSNSVWAAPELASRPRADALRQQASLRQARETSHGALRLARVLAVSRRQVELAAAPQERADAPPAAWQQPGLAREKSLRPQQPAEQPPALK